MFLRDRIDKLKNSTAIGVACIPIFVENPAGMFGNPAAFGRNSAVFWNNQAKITRNPAVLMKNSAIIQIIPI